MRIDWIELGKAARISADDAHEGDTPDVRIAYSFVLDNPECFTDSDEWFPRTMPAEPNIEFIAGYYGA